jgi:sterol desaturase/sphingolipid hydroxylase (fatty acid hydroxylase superfamily)
MKNKQEWLISKYEYYTDFVVVPVMVMTSLFMGGFTLLMFILGLTIWTLSEYILHRISHLPKFRRHHWMHHINPTSDHIEFWKTLLIVIILFLFSLLTGLTSLYAGLALGYFMFIVMHHSIHNENFITKLIPTLKHNHDIHHAKGEEKNFGVITSFWDRVFRIFKK